MLVWGSSFFLILMSFFFLMSEVKKLIPTLLRKPQQKVLLKVSSVLREIEESLMAGLIPPLDRWEMIQKLPRPWGELAWDSLSELRSSGSSLLPTLKRLRTFADSQYVALNDAQARSSQASAQVFVCSLIVPLLGVSLYLILPEVERNLESWLIACGLALLGNASGCFWLFRLSDAARWAGLRSERRSWILSVQCASERLIALIRSGHPPDLAWVKSFELIQKDSDVLALAWGSSIWQSPKFSISGKAEELIVHLASSLRKSLQVSLMEGRPCTERIETIIQSFKQDLETITHRELNLLGTRALKPLFVCVAPSLLGLLFFGIWLASAEVLNGF